MSAHSAEDAAVRRRRRRTLAPPSPSPGALAGAFPPPPYLAAPGPLTDAQVIAAGRGRFVSPLKGELIDKLRRQADPGQRNDGVNIAAPQGSSVKAAAAGEVVYAGSAIPGFGNLVLIKHAGGVGDGLCASGHHRREDAQPSRCKGIPRSGTVGQSGGVDRPQLHFEIRYPARARSQRQADRSVAAAPELAVTDLPSPLRERCLRRLIAKSPALDIASAPFAPGSEAARFFKRDRRAFGVVMTAAAFRHATTAVVLTLLAPSAALAQAPAGAPSANPLEGILTSPLPLLVVFGALFYFMILRPQQARAKAQAAIIAGIKRNDTVVLSNGVIGKVSKVDDKELGVEIATGVVVKVVRSMVQEVRGKDTPAAANDAKA